MENNIFETARKHISRSVIDSLITGEWQGKNKEICSPFRADKNPSIHMTEDGLWIDRATNDGGDLIDFISRRDNITKKEAAEKIIEMSVGVIPEKKKDEQKKYKPVIPFDSEKLKILNEHIKNKYIIEKYGTIVDGWTYRNQDGKPWICTVRFEKDGKKDVVPFYFADDGKFHAGNPVNKNRDLFNRHLLKSDSKVVIVEGEKKASIQIGDYLLMTSIGGVNQIEKSNFSILENIEEIIIIPDFDQLNDIRGDLLPEIEQPGLKYAFAIKSKLPHAKILNTYKDISKPSGYDIYDMQKEGIDLLKFIQECEEYEILQPENSDKSNVSIGNNSGNNNNRNMSLENETHPEIIAPFLFLGHNEQSHFFLPRGSNIIKKISFGSFSKTKLIELAPLSWWCMEFPDKGNFVFDSAVDWVIRCSELQGFFFPERIRGTGVWIDEERIIINDGDKLKDHSGEHITDIKSKHFYVKSEKRMGDFSGRQSTNEEGEYFVKLIRAQGFQSKLEGNQVIGWSLLAPFGGILSWRPHLWITGPKGCGKSFLLENIIEPICRPYIHRGSGKDSSPGIYRSLRNTPMPVLLDEMEPGNANNKDAKQRIEEKLELARNASSDFSANITLTNKDGHGETFCTRSCFCCSSVVPHMMGEAIESRFLLSRMNGFEKSPNKRRETKEMLETGIMKDPGIFKRRMYYNLDSFLKNIEILKDLLYEEMPNRKADNFAPVFSAIHTITRGGIIQEREGFKNYILESIEKSQPKEDISDEDILLRAIFDYTVRTQDNNHLSIAELINPADTQNFIVEEKNILLKRYGICKYMSEGKNNIPYGEYLAIATAHGSIRDILKDTMYSDRYVSVLERHPAVELTIKPSIRFAGQVKKAVLLKWNVIKKMYFDENIEIEDITDDMIPF